MSENGKPPIEEMYNRIENAIATHKKILVSVTYKVEESEYKGIYTPSSNTPVQLSP